MSLLSVPIKDRTQCYASWNSNIHEYQWSPGVGKAGHRAVCITQSADVLHVRIYVCVEPPYYLVNVFQCSDKYKTFSLWCKCSTFFNVLILIATQWNVAVRYAFHRSRYKGHLWKVFSFKFHRRNHISLLARLPWVCCRSEK